MKKLIVGITAPGSILLLEGQLNYFVSQGYDVYLITQDDPKVHAFCEKEACKFLPIIINRDISILSDFSSLFQIFKHFRRIKPDIVNLGTSKMGFLGIIAAFLANVPLRIYTSRGLRFETEKGIKRLVLMLVLKIVGFLSHRIICISEAIRIKAVGLNLFPERKTFVIKKGSSNGIDLNRFKITNQLLQDSEKLKLELNLKNEFVFGFVGRINDRKGINELIEAFLRFLNSYQAKLLIVGPVEEKNLSNKEILTTIKQHPNIIYIGFQSNIPLYMTIMDVFVLPTWSEGFGNVFIQAAAMGTPVIGTRISGVQNAICEGFNGSLTNPKDVEDIYQKMLELYSDTELRHRFSANGVEWAKNFDQKLIWEGMLDIYTAKLY